MYYLLYALVGNAPKDFCGFDFYANNDEHAIDTITGLFNVSLKELSKTNAISITNTTTNVMIWHKNSGLNLPS